MTPAESIPSLSVSGIKTYLQCREQYRYAYADRIRPVKQTLEAELGKVVHAGLEYWWVATVPQVDTTIRLAREEASRLNTIDAYGWELCRAMLVGYHTYWHGRHRYGEARTEVKFRALRHGYQWVGVLDGHVGKSILVEHKTTSQDISPGSDYWVKLKADLQVGLYWEASRAIGCAPEVMVYDVLRRPEIKPYKATPLDKRKYTKAGALYANQRDHDETPEEYGQRAADMIAADPDAYYQRAEIVRLESEVERARDELDKLALDALRVLPCEPEPRTGVMTGACRRCPYVGPCLHGESIDGRYYKEERR